MTSSNAVDWLNASDQVLDLRMRPVLARLADEVPGNDPVDHLVEAMERVMPRSSALTHLVDRFGLSPKERDALLIAAAADLKPAYAAAVAAHPLSVAGRATPGLVRAVLQCDFSLLAADGVLRRARLVSLSPGPGFADRVLSIDEPVFQALIGHASCSADIDAVSTLAPPAVDAGTRSPSRLARALARGRRLGLNPVFSLAENGFEEAASALAPIGLQVRVLPAHFLPVEDQRLIDWAARLDRDLVLTASVLGIDCGGNERDTRRAAYFADLMTAPVLIAGGMRIPPIRRTIVPIRLREGQGDDLDRWRVLLGDNFAAHERDVEAVAAHFTLDAEVMKQVAASVRIGAAPSLWTAVKAEARIPLEGLAERIAPQADWDDLVLPDGQMVVLRQMISFLAYRREVFDRWGFRAKSRRGLGLAALFAGPSGTGKTMAAEVVARAFGPTGTRGSLDLFRVDLSAIVSKYIGETEKNLARIFDAAESSGAILLFDEGDALFGKRTTQVRDSLDRHANTETAYLLQRLEAYSGIAILTTNLKGAIDEAFLRRFRFVVTFPFPDATQREAIWRTVFPADTPLGAIDYGALSRLAVSGGHIRAIALNAAFLSASEDSAVEMQHLRTAARQEYAKLDKPLSEAEMGRLQ